MPTAAMSNTATTQEARAALPSATAGTDATTKAPVLMKGAASQDYTAPLLTTGAKNTIVAGMDIAKLVRRA